MNTPTQSAFPLSIAHTTILLLALLLGWGCRSSGYHKGDRAGRSVQKASAEVKAETREIEATLAALKDLVNQPAADLKPQFRRYSKALGRLTASAQQTDNTGRKMEELGAEYFQAWDKQTSDIYWGVIREQSAARRAEVTNQFHVINARYEELQSVVWPLISYFRDIRTALSVDLTTAGLESVRSIVNNAEQNSRKVQTALARLSDELANSGTSLSTVAGKTSPPAVPVPSVSANNP